MLGDLGDLGFFYKRLFCFRKLLDESPVVFETRGRVAESATPVVSLFCFLLSGTAKAPPFWQEELFSKGRFPDIQSGIR